jgi:UDP-N-acetylmuramate dehydrogenase
LSPPYQKNYRQRKEKLETFFKTQLPVKFTERLLRRVTPRNDAPKIFTSLRAQRSNLKKANFTRNCWKTVLKLLSKRFCVLLISCWFGCKENAVAERLSFDIGPIADQLARLPEVDLKTDEMIAPYTSYRIGGPAAIWVAPRSETGIGQVLAIAHTAGMPLFILGRGSNLLVSDKGWPGVTLYLGDNISGWRFAGKEATVLAGTPLLDLIRAAVAQGLGGMELMAGIPGGIGGALRMNAGAFGQEIEQTTIAVKGFRLDGKSFEARREEINFSYRCVPDLEPVVITSGRFRFKKADAGILKSRMDDILALRAKKQPLDYLSCGSVFKRPPGYYAGALIEESGLKGQRIGGAMVSPKHAGFILNIDNAKAADVFALIRKIEDKVWQRFGVRLEREVKLIGAFD